MRRTLAALLGLCLITPGLAAPAAVKEEPKLYLALGDSLAYGLRATVPDEVGYVPHLYHSLRGLAKVDGYVNLGVPGETSASLIAGGQLAAALATINDPGTDVEVVTLDVGGNDLTPLIWEGGACYGVPADAPACIGGVAIALSTYAQNYGSILMQLRAALDEDPGDETLMVMTYYNFVSGLGAPYDQLGAPVTLGLLGLDGAPTSCAYLQTAPELFGLNDLITCVGQAFGATAVDVYPAFEGRADTLTHMLDPDYPGDFHPTNAGYAVIAAAFRDAYKDVRR